MTAPSNSATFIQSARHRVSDQEWQVRVDLAACYRLIARYGMSDLIYNHITAKIPSRPDHFLLNPFGILYTEVTASCFYTVDLQGNIIDRPQGTVGDLPINLAGFRIHGAVHAARPDVACVIHTHSRAGMAVSALKEGILPLTQTSMRFYKAIGYHDYEEPTSDVGEMERIARDLGNHKALILRNHGLLACGRSVADAWNVMYWLETACKVQIDALSTGRELCLPTDELATVMSRRYGPEGKLDVTPMEWPAMLRQLDKEDDSYRS